MTAYAGLFHEFCDSSARLRIFAHILRLLPFVRSHDTLSAGMSETCGACTRTFQLHYSKFLQNAR